MAHRGRKNSDSLIIAALAAGKTHEQAAAQAGVSLRTVARRVTGPDFRQAVLETRAALIEQATGKLADATTLAAAELVALLADESSTVRLSAARSILDTAGRYAEATDVNERIQRLEALVDAQQPQPLKGRQPWAA